MSDLMLKTWVELQTKLQTLRSDEEGQGMVEYALILVLVSIAAITVLGTMSGQINAVFSRVQTELTTALS
jgi:pilus assembly protein Flp/PilA